MHDSGDFAPCGYRALGLLVSKIRENPDVSPQEEDDLAFSRCRSSSYVSDGRVFDKEMSICKYEAILPI